MLPRGILMRLNPCHILFRLWNEYILMSFFSAKCCEFHCMNEPSQLFVYPLCSTMNDVEVHAVNHGLDILFVTLDSDLVHVGFLVIS